MKAFLAVVTAAFLSLANAVAWADPLIETPEIQFSTSVNKALADKSNALTGPVEIYEYVRNEYDHAPYHGSRSGSLNTFLGLRGNDVDLASTLIAMLRQRGVPSRYAVGTVRIPSADLQNWLGVKNLDLAVGILGDQGIQNVSLAADRSYAQLEHVWVEALVPYSDYRGVGPELTQVNCTSEPARCSWVGLDPSYKLRRNKTTLDVHDSINFDYTGYYNAIKNAATDTLKRKDKNPLTIYEEQVLAWLRVNHPGKTLEDVADAGEIVKEQAGILPASLPYQVVGSVRSYDSVLEHDAQVPAVEARKWAKYLTVALYTQKKDAYGNLMYDQYDQPVKDKLIINNKTFLLTDLATKQLTLTFESGSANCTALCAVVRLDKTVVPITGQPSMDNYDPLVLDLKLDGADTASPVSATYYNLNAVGGYYLIGTGGETSNWSQVHRAAEQLLAANDTYAEVIAAGTLHENKDALDALTGGLLNTAMNLYFSRFRDGIARVGDINHVKAPIDGFVGVVSSVYDVEFVDGTAFSVLPGGLLIDMKGQRFNGNWRDDAAATGSNKNFELIGHIMSSLEHEIWQELTGYDAVSTVRGIQMALASGAQLANPKKIGSTDTLQTEYAKFGFSRSVNATGFSYTGTNRIFLDSGNSPYAWHVASSTNDYYINWGYYENISFDLIKKQVDSNTSALRRSRKFYDLSIPDSSSIGAWLQCYLAQHNYLYYTAPDGSYGTYKSCNGTSYTGYAYCEYPYDSGCSSGNSNSIWHRIRSEYLTWFRPLWTDASFYDTAQGFNANDYVYRGADQSALVHATGVIMSIRDNLYLYNGGLGLEYLIPSTKTQTDYNVFTVYIAKQWSGTGFGDLVHLSFQIQNWGGGYVEPGAAPSAVPLTDLANMTGE